MSKNPKATFATTDATYTLLSRPRRGGILYGDLEFQRSNGGLKKTALLTSVISANMQGNDTSVVNYARGIVWNRVSNADTSVTTQKTGSVLVNTTLTCTAGIPHEQRLAAFEEAIALLLARKDLIVDGITEGGSFPVPNGTIS